MFPVLPAPHAWPLLESELDPPQDPLWREVSFIHLEEFLTENEETVWRAE